MLVAAAVLLFASITSYAGVKVSSTIGWSNAEFDSEVFSDCAKFAKKEGFKILGITPNRRRPNLDVYIFEATPELCTALDTHIQNKDNRRDN